MTICDRIEDYFAGVFQGEEKAAFKRHLGSCPTCQRRLDQLVRLDRELRERMPISLQQAPRPGWVEDLIMRTRSNN